MRPRERRESGEQDLFRSRLDQIISMDHALVKLARTIDWRFLEEKFGAVYKDGAGQPPLPTRLMAGLAILKHTYNLSDEVVCELTSAGRSFSSTAVAGEPGGCHSIAPR
jgi:IS5 family transposase